MKNKMLFMAVLCVLMVGLMGTAAYANDLDWETTGFGNESDGVVYITGYFTNNRADRVITKINWFQPNITLNYGIDGVMLDGKTGSLDCRIEPGCTYEVTFYLENPGGGHWVNWSKKYPAKYNYSYITIKG